MTTSTKRIGRYGIFAIIIIATLATCLCDIQAADKGKAGQIREIKTMDDLLKWGGIKDPKERKYVEDETKQYLQDEISKRVDAKLDITVYLQTLNHLANGESKQAVKYLAPEILKKLLENIIGGGLMKILTAAWEFDKYVWTSVQQWAEKKDMEKYQAFLLEHTKKWDRDQDLWEVERHGAQTVFTQWWDDYKNSLGKTKMYKDRQAYYITFKNDCLWHFRKVTAKYQQAKAAEANLKNAAMLMQKDLLFRLGLERENYRRATRVLLLAKQKGDMAKLVKKYWSDKAFRKQMNELAKKNSTVLLEEETGIFQNAKADIESAEISVANANKAIKDSENVSSDKINPPIIPLQLGAYQSFLSDYQTLTAEIFSNSLDGMVSGDAGDVLVASAVSEWHKNTSKFQSKVSYVRNYYESCLNTNKYSLDKAKVNRIKAEIKKIDDTEKAFNTAMLNEKRTREKQAVDDMLSLRSQVKNLNSLAAEAVPISKDVEKKFRDKKIRFRKEIDKLVNNTNYKGFSIYSYKSPESFVKNAANPLTCMTKYSEFYEKNIAAHKNYLATLESEIPALIEASADLREDKKAAVDGLETSAKPYVARWLYFFASSGLSPSTGVKIPNQARLSGELNVMPAPWRTWLDKSTKTARQAEGQLYSTLISETSKSVDMLDYEMEMDDTFRDERSLHSKAQYLLADMKVLVKPYAKVKLKKTDNWTAVNALNFLHSGTPERKALFTRMINRNHTAMKLIDGSLPGYKSALSTKTASLYRLDKQPYNAQRRYPEENAKLIEEMELALDNVNQAGTTSAQDASALKKSRAIMDEMGTIQRTTKLLSSLIDPISTEANTLSGSIRDAVLGTKIPDKEAARKTLDSFKKFVAQATKNYEDDNRTMEGYLKKAKSLITGGFGSQASDQLVLASQHKYVMELYALNKGAVAARYNVKIKELQDQLDTIGPGSGPKQKLTADDVYDFPEGENYHVTINGVSSRTLPRYQANRITSADGQIEIRTEDYDPLFKNAEKIMILLYSGQRPTDPVYKEVARNKSNFVHRLKVPYDKEYTLEVRIVTKKLSGYTPLQYPLHFQWRSRPSVKADNVEIFRIRKKGDVVSLTGKLNDALELKFTTGGANMPAELHVLGLTDQSLYNQKPRNEYAMLHGQWLELLPYSKDPAASSKFINYSTEEDESKNIRFWEFQVFIEPNAQYNVFQKVGNQWQLVAYVLGMNVKQATPPQDKGKNGSLPSDPDGTAYTQPPPESPGIKNTGNKPGTTNANNTGKDAGDEHITGAGSVKQQTVSLAGNWVGNGNNVSISQKAQNLKVTALENKGPIGWKIVVGEVKENTVYMNFNGQNLTRNISSQGNTISWSNNATWTRILSGSSSIQTPQDGSGGDVIIPVIDGKWEITCNDGNIYIYNLNLVQYDNGFYGDMIRINGNEANSKVEGMISQDGSIEFTRSRGNWKQYYVGKVVNESEGKAIQLEGTNGKQENKGFIWNAKFINASSTDVPVTGQWLADQAQGTGRLLTVISDKDMVGRNEAFRGNGKYDAIFRAQFSAPNRTVTAVEVSSTNGIRSVWDTRPNNRLWLGGVVIGGRPMNRPDGSVNFSLGSDQNTLDFCVEDNGSIKGGKTNYRMTIFFASGDPLIMDIVPGGGGGTSEGGSTSGDGNNLLINGSFEQGKPAGSSYVTINPGSTDLPGWEITGKNVDVVESAWNSSHGPRAVDIHGTGPGGIRQSFATTPGMVYSVSFDLAGNPWAGPQVKTVHVDIPGIVNKTYQFDTKGKSSRNMGWTRHSFTFRATQTRSTLHIYSNSPPGNGAGPAVDNVMVMAAAEGGSNGDAIIPVIAGEWELTCPQAERYIFNLKLTQYGNKFKGPMVCTNRSNSNTNVEGQIFPDDSFEFTRSTGNWRQYYKGKISQKSGTLPILLKGMFGAANGQEKNEWYAKSLNQSSTNISVAGQWLVDQNNGYNGKRQFQPIFSSSPQVLC